MSRFALAALAFLCAAPATSLAAQDHDFEDDEEWLQDCRDNRSSWRRRDRRARHCEIRETGLRAGGTLRVDPGRNGGVAIYAWDRDSIHVISRIQTQAYAEDEAEALAREIKVSTTGGTISADGPGHLRDREGWSVMFIVYAPNLSNLDLATHNGPVSVTGVSGNMSISAENGPVSLHGVAGDVRARVRNGPLTVVLSGSRWQGAGLDAEAVNGPVMLAIPEGYSAKLETGTVNGPMSVDFPLTVTIQGRLTQRLNTTLGDGGAPVRVVTTNGPLVIRRRGRI